MEQAQTDQGVGETHGTPSAGSASVTVRYWAAARAAAGVPSDELPVEGAITLAEVVARARRLHPDDRFARVVGACSALVGEQPVGRRDADEVVVEPGAVVELLPPFAGG